MKQVKHGTTAESSANRYVSPMSRVVFIKAQGVLCGSSSGENTDKFSLGSHRYEESDWN